MEKLFNYIDMEGNFHYTTDLSEAKSETAPVLITCYEFNSMDDLNT